MFKYEQYNDMVSRLFYEEGKRVRDITFVVTDDCNLCCSYCYQEHKGKHRMPFSVAKTFIDNLLDNANDPNAYISYANTSGIIVEFIGGEPLLEIDLMEQIVNYVTEQLIIRQSPWVNAFIFSVSSNGVLYFDERVQQLLDKYNDKFSMSITVDGNKQLHDSCRVFPNGSGSYDISVKASLDCKERFNQQGTKITLAPANIQYTSSAIIHMIELGYTMIHANCVYEEGWTNEHATIFYNELKKVSDYIINNNLQDSLYFSLFVDECCKPMDESDNRNWCGGNGEMIALDYKGDIYPCLRYLESAIGNDQEVYKIGNNELGIGNDDVHKQRINDMEIVTRKSQSTDECFSCPIAQGCGWCSAYNYQINGTINNRVTYICPMHKARALANAYFFKTLYKLGLSDKEHTMYIPDEWALQIINKEELDFLKNI